MSETLQGVRVLEIANWVAAPSARAMLADMGAEVIKIEPPDTGDAVRSLNISTKGIVTHEGGVNVSFEQLNRGKQSMGINLGTPKDRRPFDGSPRPSMFSSRTLRLIVSSGTG